MLPSIHRLNSVEFKKNYNKGIIKNSKNIRVSFIYKKTNEDVFSKYAVIVGKKISKSAIVRHKIKRKIYNSIQEMYPQFSNLKFIFIFIKADISNIDREEIENEIQNLLSING